MHFPQIVLFVEARLYALEAFFLLHLGKFFFQALDLLRRSLFVAFEICALRKIKLGNQLCDAFIAHAFVELVEKSEILIQHRHELRQVFAFELGRAVPVADDEAVSRPLHHDFHEFALVLDVLLRLALLQRKQRRLSDIDVAALDQRLHLPEEKRQQERSNVRSVHVGVGHQNDFAVT